MSTIYVIQRFMQTEEGPEMKWLDASHFYQEEGRALDGYVTAVRRFPDYKMQLVKRMTTEEVIRGGEQVIEKKKTAPVEEDF